MAASSRARGDATRNALIESALEIFGRDGYHAASTRAIAAAAGANQALIGFHFGGKKGLYMATFEHVMNRILGRMGPLMQDVAVRLNAAPEESTRAAARLKRYLPMVHRVTDALVAMFAAEESRSWARLILREQQDPSEAFETHYDRSFGTIASIFTELLARAQGRSAEDREVRLLMFTILGQAMVFRAASATVLKRLRIRRIGGEEVAAIQGLIRRNVTAMLKAGVAS